MNLSDYRTANGISQARFAELLTAAGSPATQALISQWEKGSTKVTAERVAKIEEATAGAVTRHDLRPDIFGPAPSADTQKAV